MTPPRRDLDPPPGLPLCQGASGEPVRDLQRRLSRAGLPVAPDAPGSFGDATEAAVSAFQGRSGLEVTGICDGPTWSVLVEAGYQLGDRLLYHRTPMLRGDDVTALQRRLSELGFQSDRVDGIFGPNTAAAVESFQRNMGLVTDSVVGPDVLDQLRRLGSRTGSVTKAHLQERVTLLGASRFLAGTRVVLAEQGSLPALVRAVTQLLDQAGADTLAVHHPEGSVHAAEANRFAAQVFVGLCARAEPGARLSYYRTEGFESAGGRHLAEVVSEALQDVPLPQPIQIQGMRIPVLRETRMPALWCEIGPTSFVVEHAAAVAEAIAVAITSWVSAPLDDLGAN